MGKILRYTATIPPQAYWDDDGLPSPATMSAFGDPVAVDNTPVVQIDFIYGINTQLGVTSTLNGGSADTNGGRLRLQSSTNSSGNSTYASLRPAKYRQGQGITARFTAVFPDGGAEGNTQIIGVGNAVDGYFVGFNGTSFGICYRNNSVNTWIPRSNWNGSLDQTTFNLDTALGNVWMIRYPFLGYGAISFYLLAPHGSWILVHTIEYPNSSQNIQLSNPNLSFYAQTVNTGSTINRTIYVGSVGIFINGMRKFLGPAYGISSLKSINGTGSVLAIKNAASYNGVTNRSLVRLKSVSFASDGGNGTTQISLVKGATLTNPVWTLISGSGNSDAITNGQSVSSYDVAATAAGGVIQFNTALARNSSQFADVSELDLYIEPGQTIYFQAITSIATSVVVAVNWVEDI